MWKNDNVIESSAMREDDGYLIWESSLQAGERLNASVQGLWLPVTGVTDYPTDKGTACTVNFNPVKTKALRLEVTLPTDNATGLFEWSVR